MIQKHNKTTNFESTFVTSC